MVCKLLMDSRLLTTKMAASKIKVKSTTKIAAAPAVALDFNMLLIIPRALSQNYTRLGASHTAPVL
ncbi:hypothetical protein GCM10017783_16340 [Deinococcus piscis]|uniref:Uncharacterized protein n=1 Tax=Deinococcus piscis TaxID=394230 RepID=A0ABQ3K6T3_9DEIO|nr:hypothetical protein GCM10017783_16340 [Deinococcus piscis]